jgi:8-oxo-dGTP diphosphatase
VGETAIGAVVREVREEAGIDVKITGLVGLFTDPGLVVRSAVGEVRQPFSVVFRAQAIRGLPHGDLHETSQAAWIPVVDIPDLPLEPVARVCMGYVLDASRPLGDLDEPSVPRGEQDVSQHVPRDRGA